MVVAWRSVELPRDREVKGSMPPSRLFLLLPQLIKLVLPQAAQLSLFLGKSVRDLINDAPLIDREREKSLALSGIELGQSGQAVATTTALSIPTGF